MSKLFDFDKESKSAKFLIGTDEAGRGPLAGPVVAAAVCFSEITPKLLEELEDVNDSKKLTHAKRVKLFDKIKENSVYAITSIDVKDIEEINILNAALKAMRISCQNVIKQIGHDVEIFVDGKIKVPRLKIKQNTLIKGDGKSASIAAASILAKVYRDNLMIKLAKQYPQYSWDKNKGYGTAKHIEAIKLHGITPFHRQSFLKNILADKVVEQKLLF